MFRPPRSGFEEDSLPPESRSGSLWALYLTLAFEGWMLDTFEYTTSFRVRFPQPNPANSLEAFRARLVAADLEAKGESHATGTHTASPLGSR